MWTQEMFGVEKPIIALLHLDALPGDPGYIAAFTYGVSLGESIPQCMARGKALATRIVQQFEPYLQEKEQ